MDLDVSAEQVVILTAGGNYSFFLFRGYMKMLWMTLVMKVPAGYGTVSDWGKPELGLRISYSGEADQTCVGEGV